MKTKTFTHAFTVSLLTLFSLVTSPAWAVPQEGAADPGQGLTALETTLYFVLAPLGLFLTIVVLGYAIHRPRDGKSKATNVLTEIR
ncbi:MAG: hypothetical protein ACKN9O_04475 [Actinomycetota bacterium]